MATKRIRDSYGDWVIVEEIQAKDLRRGDIIRMASDMLRIEETPIVEKGRIKIAARSQKEAGGMVRRSYLASQVFNVERAADAPMHHATKPPAQLQREIDEALAQSTSRTRTSHVAKKIHLLKPRGGTECGEPGRAEADINWVTCEKCLRSHDRDQHHRAAHDAHEKRHAHLGRKPSHAKVKTSAAARNAAVNLRDATAHRARIAEELSAFAKKHRDVHWQTGLPGRESILAEYERIRGRMLAADRAEAIAWNAMAKYRP